MHLNVITGPETMIRSSASQDWLWLGNGQHAQSNGSRTPSSVIRGCLNPEGILFHDNSMFQEILTCQVPQVN